LIKQADRQTMPKFNNSWISLFILLSAHLLTILDIFIINVAIPSIQQGLHSSDSEIQLIIAMYMIGFASFLIPGGKAGDYYGRKRVFLLGMLFFMLSSLGCFLAKTSELLIFMRFFQGVSAAFMSPQVLSFIQVLFVGHQERTRAIGWYGVTIGIGTMLGQFLGGYLINLEPIIVEQSWRYIFLVNIPICIAGIILSKVILAESKDSTALRMDYTGAIIFNVGAILLIFTLTIGTELEIADFLTGLLTSLTILTVFGLYQRSRSRKKKTILLNTTLFRHKNFNAAVVAVALFMVMLDAYFFILTIFLQKGLQLQPMEAGYFVVAQGFGFIFSSLFVSKLVLRFGKSVLIFGTILIIVASVIQLVIFYLNHISFILYIIMMIHGCGVALVLPSLANIALKGIAENLIGNASGVYSTLQQISGACGIALIGGLFYHLVKGHSEFRYYYDAFLYSMIVNVACMISVLVILLWLPKTTLPQIRSKGCQLSKLKN
jgi:EmrB/QacA subfamily drug resistance transporter